VLERAGHSEIIVLVGVGQGCDTIILRTTETLAAWQKARRDTAPPPIVVDDYTRFLFNLGQLKPDLGLRSWQHKIPPFSAIHRNRDHALGLIGGRCRRCGTFQLPKSRICVAPDCRFIGDQDDVGFSELPGRVVSWTADYLVASRAPPAIYGAVHFDPGGSYIFNFADVREEEMDVGLPVQMVFRVHDIDERTGIHNYFWKASLRPTASAAGGERLR
jgi:hydroxymethylglutaryl-CoA synthase